MAELSRYPQNKPYSLNKQERLKHRRLISQIFDDGHSFVIHPIRLVWLVTDLPADIPVQAAFSVSHKRVPKATQRNAIKRRMREAYRYHKSILYSFFESKGKQCGLVLIYLKKDLLSFEELEATTVRCLKKLKQYEKGN